ESRLLPQCPQQRSQTPLLHLPSSTWVEPGHHWTGRRRQACHYDGCQPFVALEELAPVAQPESGEVFGRSRLGFARKFCERRRDVTRVRERALDPDQHDVRSLWSQLAQLGS